MKRTCTIYLLTAVLSLLGLHLSAQEVTLSGVVLDKAQNGPIPGVTVSVIQDEEEQASQAVGMTNLEGQFKISVPLNATVQFSFLGFESYTTKAEKDQSGMEIHLVEALNLLDQTVVVGYTSKSLADVTSTVTVIDADDLVETPVANVMELVQGRVPGLNVQLNNGTPGMQGTYTIRGISDISVSGEGDNMILGSSNPLFVVDGIPQEDVGEFNAQGLLDGSGISPISMIPVEDIDNIQILRDAAATALYGSRGAYGVIIINTKRGNSPKPIVSYNTSFKISTPPRLRDVMVGMTERNSRIYQLLTNDTSAYQGYYDIHENPILSDSLNPYFNNNTDWQSIFYRTTYNQNHNLQFSGGDPSFNYKVNGNYFQENGIIEKTGFERYGVGMQIEYAPTERFEMTAKASATLGLSNKGSGNALGQTGVANGSNASSLLPPPSLYTTTNDVLKALSVDDQATSVAYDASLRTFYRLPHDISWNSVFGYSYKTDERETLTPGILVQDRAENGAQALSRSLSSYNVYLRSSVSYMTRLSAVELGLTLGGELSLSNKTASSIVLNGLPNGILGPIGYNPSLSSGSASLNINNNTASITIAPHFGIGSFKKDLNIGKKYIFNPSIRPEINSAYGSKAKFAINPGFGFKWNFSMEPFMQKFDFLSFGAIRTTWGRTSRYKANIYDIWGAYLLNEEGSTYNGENYIPVDYSSMPNPDLKPVKSTMWNLGLDLYFLDQAVTFNGDVYYKQIDNQLSSLQLADHNSFDDIKSTDVSLVNYGLEMVLGVSPLKRGGDFGLRCNFVLAINKDVITRLPNDARQIINGNIVNKLGSNALSNYLFVYKGVYARDEDVPVDPSTRRRLRMGGDNSESEEAYFKAGDPIFVDLNGDYIIDEKDMTIVGNSQPRMTGGINLNFRYKSLSINTNCSFTLRRDIINSALSERFGFFNNPMGTNATSSGVLAPIDAYNFWTPENRNADYPNPYDYTRVGIIDPFRANQTLFMEDGSYFKINGISLSYSVSKRILNVFGLRSASITASANNIHTFSNYSGVNPENVSSLGYDRSSGYPNSRAYTLGMHITF